MTPLHDASAVNSLEVAELLLWNKADIHEIDRTWNTPLHMAVQNGHEAMVKLLLENDAKVNVEDQQGKTPLEQAQGNAVISKLLLQHASANEAVPEHHGGAKEEHGAKEEL